MENKTIRHRETVRRYRERHPYIKVSYRERNCRNCDKPFKPIRIHSKFCSKFCMDQYYRKTHKEQIKMWIRNNWLGSTRYNGLVRKRPWTGYCELCDIRDKRLSWHHWDNKHPELGLWLCQFCHTAVEKYEAGIIEKYKELKEMINNESD